MFSLMLSTYLNKHARLTVILRIGGQQCYLHIPGELHLQHVVDQVGLQLDKVLLCEASREVVAKEIPDQTR